MIFTFEQAEEILNSQLASDYDCNPHNFMHEDVGIIYEIEKKGFEKVKTRLINEATTNEGIIEAEQLCNLLAQATCVEDYGGTDQGSDYYTIFYFKNSDLYIKFQGWYASHHGADYQEMYEVKPEEKVITVYNRV